MPLEPEDWVEEELPGTKRLQTKPSYKPDKARVVVTFHVEIEHAERVKMATNPGDTDAVSIMREHVAEMMKNTEKHPTLRQLFLSSMLKNSMSMEVEVAK